jgi:rare lipoprotein A
VTVTNLANGKSTTCVINDRGPYVAGRIIDMDTTIFSRIASTSQGVVQVRITW